MVSLHSKDPFKLWDTDNWVHVISFLLWWGSGNRDVFIPLGSSWYVVLLPCYHQTELRLHLMISLANGAAWKMSMWQLPQNATLEIPISTILWCPRETSQTLNWQSHATHQQDASVHKALPNVWMKATINFLCIPGFLGPQLRQLYLEGCYW